MDTKFLEGLKNKPINQSTKSNFLGQSGMISRKEVYDELVEEELKQQQWKLMGFQTVTRSLH